MRISMVEGVVKSLAHFALSGIAYGAPERTLSERRADMKVIVARLAGESCGIAGKVVSMLSASEKLSSMLVAAGIDPSDIDYAIAEFYFKGQCRTAGKCVVTIRLTDGRSVSGEYTNSTFG